MNKNKHDELDDNSFIEQSDNPIAEKDIYENGKLFNIKAKELLNNEIAIRQLINNHNVTNRQLAELQRINKAKDLEISLLRATGFISLSSIIINVISTVLIGFAINFLVGSNMTKTGISFLIIGVLCGILGNALPVLYPIYIKKLEGNK